ncbi:AraC family transcriptional regulator [Phenylobacterium sp.]|uniref:helix-turn-helix domain-containing protein n=1 Tax=Phenylobacterium sp. TaxID=1871053 RepID=UPI002EDB5E16
MFALLALRIAAGGRSPARLTGAVFSLAAAAHTVTQSRPALEMLGLAGLPVWAASVAGAGLFWAFALELFGDHARLAPVRLLPALGLLGIGVIARLSPDDVARGLWLTHNLLGALLMIHVLVVVWTGWRGDLVEARRRLRGPLLALAAVYTLAVAAVQIVELYAGPATALSFLAAVSLLILSLASGFVFLRDDPQLFGAQSVPQQVRRVAPRDEPLAQRLMEALDQQEVWREEGLTIGGLAQRLGAPEHHLRRLINEGLGYRNFAAFLNERRIAAAKAALADPANARVAVSVIAFEVGFSSLAPFNRTFREIAGQTPTAWRLSALSSKPDDPPRN